jgi:hypothetical protein
MISRIGILFKRALWFLLLQLEFRLRCTLVCMTSNGKASIIHATRAPTPFQPLPCMYHGRRSRPRHVENPAPSGSQRQRRRGTDRHLARPHANIRANALPIPATAPPSSAPGSRYRPPSPFLKSAPPLASWPPCVWKHQLAQRALCKLKTALGRSHVTTITRPASGIREMLHTHRRASPGRRKSLGSRLHDKTFRLPPKTAGA